MSEKLVSISTNLDVGLDEPIELCTLGKDEQAAWISMANFLHLHMFQCDVRNDIYADYDEEWYTTEQEFLNACRNYICHDPNAITSDRIWTSLKNAVDNAIIEK